VAAFFVGVAGLVNKEDIANTTRDGIQRLTRSRPGFKEVLDKLMGLGPVAVGGGAVRDWALGLEPRDIDLVVNVHELILRQATGPTHRTAMGGSRFMADDVHVDVWALPSTWAFLHTREWEKIPFSEALARQEDRAVGFSMLPRVMPHNLDAVLVELGTWQVHDHGFLNALETHVLEVNYEPTPSPAVSIARALSSCLRYRMKPGQSIRDYVAKHIPELGWPAILQLYEDRYGWSADHALVCSLQMLPEVHRFFEGFPNPEDKDRTIDHIYDVLDDWLLEGRCDLVRDVLRNVPTDTTLACLLSYLTVTLPWKEQLPERAEFLRRVEGQIRRDCPEQERVLLQGLE
jgi:hypothetical protein